MSRRLAIQKRYKTVAMPIRVPNNDYCWTSGDTICEHFDNTGGSPHCELGINILKYDKVGVPKPDKCNNLKDTD